MPQGKKAASEAVEEQEQQVTSQAGSTAEAGPLPSAPYVSPDGEVKRPRDDSDALTGLFANIVSGEFAPRYVVVGRTLERDQDGFPTRVEVKTRDARDERLEVDYADLRPAAAGQR